LKVNPLLHTLAIALAYSTTSKRPASHLSSSLAVFSFFKKKRVLLPGLFSIFLLTYTASVRYKHSLPTTKLQATRSDRILLFVFV
jgi:hypothetical protein